MFTVLDVSRWQGRIDWDTVKASGRVHGVMLRALGSRSGTPYIDPMFDPPVAHKRVRTVQSVKRINRNRPQFVFH